MGNGQHSGSHRKSSSKDERKYWKLLANMIACHSHQTGRGKGPQTTDANPDVSSRHSPCVCHGENIVPTHRKLHMLINQHDQWGLAPLHRACEIGNADIVHILLHFGALPNLTSSVNHGYTSPLLIAASGGHTECTRLLLKFGADVNQTDCWGNSALYKASCYNFSDCVALLLEYNARPNMVNKWGALPLQYAAIQGNHQVVSLLLENGADVQMWGEEREPQAVTGAVIRGHHECLQLLLDAGAPVNLPGIIGTFSPLEALVYYGCEHLTCLKLLLDYNATVTPLALTYLHQCNDCAFIAKHRPAFIETLLTGIGSANKLQQELKEVFIKLTQSANIYQIRYVLHLLIQMGLSLSVKNVYDILGRTKCQLTFKDSADLMRIASNPLPLASLCRIKIRSNLNVPVQRSIEKLPVPNMIKDYLKLNRLLITSAFPIDSVYPLRGYD